LDDPYKITEDIFTMVSFWRQDWEASYMQPAGIETTTFESKHQAGSE